MAKARTRDTFLTVMAVLYALLAVSNFTKPLQSLRDPHMGTVIFGHRFEGVASNLLFGPLMGIVLGMYAYGLWKMRPWVVTLSVIYAFYVPTNLVLFWYLQTGPDIPAVAGLLGYLAIAFTGSIGTALYLARYPEKFV